MIELIQNKGYQYVAMGFAGLFLLPQIWKGYNKKQLKDLSSTSMCFVIIASGLWTFYMYEVEEYEYAIATGFVGSNALILGIMQFYFWFTRVKDHMKNLDVATPGHVINITNNDTGNDNAI